MQLPLGDQRYDIVPGRKLSGHVAGTLVASGRNFVTSAVPSLDLDLEGIVGDIHRGYGRRSGGREPWYGRGTLIRNERQLSVVCPDELAQVAHDMGLAEARPEWIGANLVLEGIPDLSMVPSGTLLFFEGGVTLKVDGQNHPCKLAGRSIADHVDAADRDAVALSFVKAAKRRRGLVAWVEKPGTVTVGERVSARIPEQWIYTGR